MLCTISCKTEGTHVRMVVIIHVKHLKKLIFQFGICAIDAVAVRTLSPNHWFPNSNQQCTSVFDWLNSEAYDACVHFVVTAYLTSFVLLIIYVNTFWLADGGNRD